MTAAVFLDRDGVLCENRGDYVKVWTEFRWIPGARRALRLLAGLEMPVVLVTNQSAINRGLTTFEAVRHLHGRMRRSIEDDGGRLDALYICPHRPDEGCQCRKPGVLLFRQAAVELGVSLEESYLIGDSLADVQAGSTLGLRVLLVRTGLGEETSAKLNGGLGPVQVVSNILEAAQCIEGGRREAGTRERAAVSLTGIPSSTRRGPTGSPPVE